MHGPTRTLLSRSSRALTARAFSTTARRMADSGPLPARKPVGAFRGGLFGFLLGCVVSGGAVYNYLLQEYKTSNDILTEDIYILQRSVTSLSNYVKMLEDRIPGKK